MSINILKLQLVSRMTLLDFRFLLQVARCVRIQFDFHESLSPATLYDIGKKYAALASPSFPYQLNK